MRQSAALFCVLGFALLAAHLSPAARTQQRPTFRTGVTIVPLDVRVLDANDRPVTDLARADFVVLEDGVPQTISQFFRQTVPGELVAPSAGATSLRLAGAAPALAPRQQRAFLIVLGSGVLQGPSKGMEALVEFVRHRLAPQDLVAVFAWNRATDFSIQHQEIAALVERVWATQAEIDALQRMGGTAALIQAKIDAAFGPATGRASRRAESAPQRASDPSPLDLDLGLSEYVGARQAPSADASRLAYAINYLRWIDGEKHLIFMSRQGGSFETGDQVSSIAATASDSRVTLHAIQTGGIPGDPGAFLPSFPGAAGRDPNAGRRGESGSDEATRPVSGANVSLWEPNVFYDQLNPPLDNDGPTKIGPVPVPGFSTVVWPGRRAGFDRGSIFQISDLRALAAETGGVVSAMGYADKALAGIDALTRESYLLAYESTNARMDGRYHRIQVKVTRPGVRVLSRRGYYARPIAPFERRAFLTTNRIAVAGYAIEEDRDIRVTLTASEQAGGATSGAREERDILVRASIDASNVQFTSTDNGRHTAQLTVAVYCGDYKEKVIGETRRAMDLKLSESTYQRYQKQGIPFEVRLPVTGYPRFVKVIVYDYAADLTGSATIAVR